MAGSSLPHVLPPIPPSSLVPFPSFSISSSPSPPPSLSPPNPLRRIIHEVSNGLDPKSKRILSNRKAAQKSHDKKKKEHQSMQVELKKLKSENEMLIERIRQLEAQTRSCGHCSQSPLHPLEPPLKRFKESESTTEEILTTYVDFYDSESNSSEGIPLSPLVEELPCLSHVAASTPELDERKFYGNVASEPAALANSPLQLDAFPMILNFVLFLLNFITYPQEGSMALFLARSMNLAHQKLMDPLTFGKIYHLCLAHWTKHRKDPTVECLSFPSFSHPDFCVCVQF